MKWSTLKAALKECRLNLLLLITQLFFDAPHQRVAKIFADLARLYRLEGKLGKAEQHWRWARLMLDSLNQNDEAKSLGMYQVIEGVHKYQKRVFKHERDLFERLSQGQSPDVLFITCSDSRIVTSRVTQTKPGDLFVLRNAGNIVPRFGTASGSEDSTIEFAVNVVKVKDIVIVGHTHCGAMKGLLNPEKLEALPATHAWLAHAAEAKQSLLWDSQTHEDQLLSLIKANVELQLDHLKSHPAVSKALDEGAIRLHGWLYMLESAKILSFEAVSKSWHAV